jgi:hypothetical protein
MAILKYILIFFIAILTLGCSKGDGSACFTSAGDIVTDERVFDAQFTSIILEDNATLTIKQDSVYSVYVTGGNKLIESYITQVEGNALVISNNTNCDFIRDLSTPYEVTVTMPELDSILFNGYGNIYSDGIFEVDTFRLVTTNGVGNIFLNMNGTRIELVQQTGAGNVSMTGTVDYTYVYSTSYAIVDLKDLHSTNGFYVNGGTGDFTINTTDYIKVKLELSGDIYYTNDPEIFIETYTGSGQLIHY